MNVETVKLDSNAKPSPATPTPPPSWRLGADRDGLQGSVEAVRKAITENTQLPEHFRAALLAGIQAALEGTDHNYVVLHASGHGNHGEKTRRHMVLIDLETSKELI